MQYRSKENWENKALKFGICATRPKTASHGFQQSKDSMQSSADGQFVKTAKMKEGRAHIISELAV
jgi:hypothetical protein